MFFRFMFLNSFTVILIFFEMAIGLHKAWDNNDVSVYGNGRVPKDIKGNMYSTECNLPY